MTANALYEERPRFGQWLIEPMRRNRSSYVKVALAAALINIFGLVTSLFSMTVYDRILPNNATSSLVALSIGLLIVVVFDFVLRSLRGYFVDVAGMNVDRDVGDFAFQRLLAQRLEFRRGSTGAMAGVIRELETLRDFFASATLSAVIDVPFIIITLLVIYWIGGILVLVPLLMVPLVVIAGLVTYPAMDRLSSKVMNQGLNKQAVLVETIGGIETVKATGAGHLLRKRWLAATDSYSDNAMSQRLLSTFGLNIANSAQTLSYAGVIIFGVNLIIERELTMGGLIACSILSGRAVAPLGQIAQLLSRLTSTRTAYKQINAFVAQPSEMHDSEPLYIGALTGAIEFRNVTFRYPGTTEDALKGITLAIAPGERVALLGRVGSGKSTLMRMATGLYRPTDGMVLIDGTDLRQLDLPSLREKVGVALQDNVLLTGSVRENILLDRPGTDDAELLRVAKLSGTHDYIGRIANGYELKLADRGESLSGGQRQSIAVARALVNRPQIVIMDEPTSGMDTQTEEALITRLLDELKGRTVLVSTHRTPLLRLVDRIIIVADGKVAADGPRDAVLKRLANKPVAA